MNIYGQIGSNKRASLFIAAVFILLFLLIGAGCDYYYGAGVGIPYYTAIALGAGVLMSLGSFFYGDQLVLSSTGAREPDETDLRERQWQNVVGEMAIAAGLPTPRIFVIDDPDPNAFATGRDPRHASIAATRGLLEALDRDELQAVAAHEMSHIKNYDIRLMLIVAVLVGAIALLADWAGRSCFRPHRRENRQGKSGGELDLILFVVWLAAVILAPIISRLMAMAVSRKREYLADASGAELTRHPLALASALEKIASYAGPTKAISRGSAHLCIEDPLGRQINEREGWFANLFATHPPIARRVAALKGMAYQGTTTT